MGIPLGLRTCQLCAWSGPIAPVRLVETEPGSGDADVLPDRFGTPRGGCGITTSTPPSRHAFGLANTTLQPEHW